jgi:5-methyltetrahydrofolate--homocysteine methyltransferase
MVTISEALSNKALLIFDGATGTQLAARGAAQSPLANIESPEVVKSIHRDYRDAGANVVLTNTLTANRIAMEHAGTADKLVEINTAGARLCREAVGDDCYVCGDMGSTGQFLEPLGDYTEAQFAESFAEQARILAESGVDLIIIETMTDVREAAIAVKAVKSAVSIPVIGSIAFDPAMGGCFCTMMGDTVAKAVTELTAAGADVIGANCGTVDPNELSLIIAEMRSSSDIVLIAQPNAGKPEIVEGQVRFRWTPTEFAEGAMKCVEAGATLVGGCCGTTPAHIAELASRLR